MAPNREWDPETAPPPPKRQFLTNTVIQPERLSWLESIGTCSPSHSQACPGVPLSDFFPDRKLPDPQICIFSVSPVMPNLHIILVGWLRVLSLPPDPILSPCGPIYSIIPHPSISHCGDPPLNHGTMCLNPNMYLKFMPLFMFLAISFLFRQACPPPCLFAASPVTNSFFAPDLCFFVQYLTITSGLLFLFGLHSSAIFLC